MANLSELHRRMSKKIEMRRGLQLSAEDLDLLVISGAFEALTTAASAELRQRALSRQDARSSGKPD